MYIDRNLYYFDVIECIRLVINKKANKKKSTKLIIEKNVYYYNVLVIICP